MYQTSERTLDAPDLVDDYYLNLLDWGSSNVLAIALGGTVYLWDASDGSTSELVTLEDETGPVTSVSWAPDGRHIAIGLNNSDVQLWDSTANRLVWISTLNWTLNLRCSSGFSPCFWWPSVWFLISWCSHFCSWELWKVATHQGWAPWLGTITSLQLEEWMVKS